MNTRLDISTCLSQGWQVFINNSWLALFGIALPLGVGIVNMIVGMIPILGWLAAFLAIFMVWPHVYAGVFNFMLNVARRQQAVFDDVWAGFRNYHRVIGVGLVWVIGSFVLYLPTFIIGGLLISSALNGGGGAYKTFIVLIYILNTVGALYLMLRYAYVWFLMVDEPQLTVRQVYDRSAELTEGNRGQLFIVMLAVWFIAMAGFLVFFIGALFTIPIAILIFARSYLILRGETELPPKPVAVQPPLPPTQPE